MLSSPNCWCHMAQAGDSCWHQSTCQGSEEGSQEFGLEATGALGLGGVWRRVAGLSNPLVHRGAGKGGARSSLPGNCNYINYPGWLRAGSHTEAGASSSPTWHLCHHPSRASSQAWAMLCSKGGSHPMSPSCQTSRVTPGVTLSSSHHDLWVSGARHTHWSLAGCWEGRAGIPVTLRDVTRVPDCCQSLRTAVQEQAGWCVWDLAPGCSLSPCPSDAMESSKQERALPLLAALPALGLDAADKRP